MKETATKDSTENLNKETIRTTTTNTKNLKAMIIKSITRLPITLIMLTSRAGSTVKTKRSITIRVPSILFKRYRLESKSNMIQMLSCSRDTQIRKESLLNKVIILILKVSSTKTTKSKSRTIKILALKWRI